MESGKWGENRPKLVGGLDGFLPHGEIIFVSP
jgi:hypothetical protein